MQIFLICEHGISFLLFRFSLISFSLALQCSIYKLCILFNLFLKILSFWCYYKQNYFLSFILQYSSIWKYNYFSYIDLVSCNLAEPFISGNLFIVFSCRLGFPDSSVGKESACNAGDPGSISWVGKIHWRRDRLPTPVCLGFPCGSAGKESACNEGELGLIPGLGRSPGEGEGYPLQHSGLENSMD